MRFPKPYHLADETIDFLNRKAVRRAEEAKRTLNVMKFDELNVMKAIDALYKGLDADNRKALRQLYCDRYTELWLFLKGKKPDEDMLDDLVDMYLAGLLGKPNDLTKYTYDTEVIRKRDRAKEAILSSPTKAQKQIEVDKAIRYWSAQTGFYVDICEDGATLQAYEDADIAKVKWNTQEDNKVCSDCEEKDGMIFPVNKIPEKPHLRCRCFLTPVR